MTKQLDSTPKAFQDYYADSVSYCFGCGRLNERGLHIKTNWDGEETVTRFRPEPFHTAVPGFVYGGLIASLIDCHSTGSAAAAAYRAQQRAMDTDPPLRFVTASLHVDYLRPASLGVEIELRGKVEDVRGRKVIVTTEVRVEGELCARGEVVAVQMPEDWGHGAY